MIRLATRESKLALWQAEAVKKHLQVIDPELEIEFVKINTKGDQIQDRPLREVGGKGLFVKGLEEALIYGEADIAVHSMKDVPATLDPTFTIAGVLPRATPLDVFISTKATSIDELPENARVGTSSLRRQSQLLALRPDLSIQTLRGNIQTRLRKAIDGEFDGIILAQAGLQRMGFEKHITQVLPIDSMLPASNQGAIGLEVLSDNQSMIDLCKMINHWPSFKTVMTERSMCQSLNGSCHSPIGAFAEFDGTQVHLRGLVAAADGSRVIQAEAFGDDPETVGEQAAEILLDQGARDFL